MILMRDETIIAKHGQLSSEGFHQFAQAVQRHWPGCDQGDLDRQFEMTLEDQFKLIFTRYDPSGDYLLGLVYPVETPLKHMRRDAADLMRLVTTFDENTGGGDDRLEQSLQLSGQPTSTPDPPSLANVVPEGWQIENDTAGQLEDDIVPEESLALPEAPKNKNKAEDQESQTDGLRWQPLDALLPSEGAIADSGSEIEGGIVHRIDHLTAQLGDLTPSPDDDLVSFFQDDGERHLDQNTLNNQQTTSTSVTDHDPFLGQDTRPVSCNEDEISLAETVMDTTFYLVPRLNDHYLLGELALELREWFPALCEIYGWELASLSVCPDYLKWTLLDFPECLMRDMLGVVRDWTSTRIFKSFSALQVGNPTQDFWSPGFLMDTQNREFPIQVLVTHVSRSRITQESPVG